MSLETLSERLLSRHASLQLEGQRVLLKGPRAALEDAGLRQLIMASRSDIVELLKNGGILGGSALQELMPDRIARNCQRITPELLSPMDLTQEEIDGLVMRVPGGAANVQDVYPLLPAQEGILFHYLTARHADPYRLWTMVSFDDAHTVQSYVRALNSVISRHDILRTAVIWEGVRQPVQVVWRSAPIEVECLQLNCAETDVEEQFWRMAHSHHSPIDITKAPMMRLIVAQRSPAGECLGIQLCHHLAIDRVAAEVMNAEIRLYMADRGTQLPRPATLRSFVFQARADASRADHEAFFRDMLDSVDEPTAPFGLMESDGDGVETKDARAELDSILSRRLCRQAKMQRVSVASLFHVAWGMVLSHLSGRDRPVFGTVILGRMNGRECVERVLGPFINLLPIAIDLRKVAAECICATHRLLIQLLEHEQTPLVMAQRCSQVLPPAPLFTAVLNYRHRGADSGRVQADVEAKLRRVSGDVPNNYALTMSVDELSDGFLLTAQIDESEQPARIVAMTMCALDALVTALEQTSTRAVNELNVLPLAEYLLLLKEWNDTAAWYPRGCGIHQLFQDQVTRTPNRPALVQAHRSLTYQQLDELSNQFAHLLIAASVQPGDVVGIFMGRSLEMVVALLGILKCGSAYLPLDPKYPVQRLDFMLHDARVKVLVSDVSVDRIFPRYSGIVVMLTDLSSLADKPVTRPARVSLGGAAAVCLIYTSGSTGVPKGVLGCHRMVVNRLHAELPEARSDGIYAMKTSISFIDALWEVFMPLISGAVAKLIAHDDLMHPERLVERLGAEGITHLVLVPSLLHEILDAMRDLGLSLPDLRYCSCGGEPLPADMARRFVKQIPGARLANCYGTSEFWDAASYSEPVAQEDASVPIGRPMANVRVYVLDQYLMPVPIGVEGDLYVAGDGLPLGYQGHTRLTAERLVACPFENGCRMYRTGDRARWRRERQLEYRGRADRQIKIRGYRVEPGEVELILRSYRGVTQAVVVADDADKPTGLIAYIVRVPAASTMNPVGEGELDCPGDVDVLSSDLRRFVAAKLPDFMVPRAFVVMDAMPLTPSGKIDRNALPRAQGRRSGTAHPYVSPRNDLEKALTAIWESVLELDRVGTSDSFFELGGNSIDAIRMINQVKATVGLRLSYGELFERQTIASLCEARVELSQQG